VCSVNVWRSGIFPWMWVGAMPPPLRPSQIKKNCCRIWFFQSYIISYVSCWDSLTAHKEGKMCNKERGRCMSHVPGALNVVNPVTRSTPPDVLHRHCGAKHQRSWKHHEMQSHPFMNYHRTFLGNKCTGHSFDGKRLEGERLTNYESVGWLVCMPRGVKGHKTKAACWTAHGKGSL
jgi:hypothetical protein